MTTKKTTTKTSKKSTPAKKAVVKKVATATTSGLSQPIKTVVAVQTEKVTKTAVVKKGFFAKIKSWF